MSTSRGLLLGLVAGLCSGVLVLALSSLLAAALYPVVSTPAPSVPSYSSSFAPPESCATETTPYGPEKICGATALLVLSA